MTQFFMQLLDGFRGKYQRIIEHTGTYQALQSQHDAVAQQASDSAKELAEVQRQLQTQTQQNASLEQQITVIEGEKLEVEKGMLQLRREHATSKLARDAAEESVAVLQRQMSTLTDTLAERTIRMLLQTPRGLVLSPRYIKALQRAGLDVNAQMITRYHDALDKLAQFDAGEAYGNARAALDQTFLAYSLQHRDVPCAAFFPGDEGQEVVRENNWPTELTHGVINTLPDLSSYLVKGEKPGKPILTEILDTPVALMTPTTPYDGNVMGVIAAVGDEKLGRLYKGIKDIRKKGPDVSGEVQLT